MQRSLPLASKIRSPRAMYGGPTATNKRLPTSNSKHTAEGTLFNLQRYSHREGVAATNIDTNKRVLGATAIGGKARRRENSGLLQLLRRKLHIIPIQVSLIFWCT